LKEIFVCLVFNQALVRNIYGQNTLKHEVPLNNSVKFNFLSLKDVTAFPLQNDVLILIRKYSLFTPSILYLA